MIAPSTNALLEDLSSQQVHGFVLFLSLIIDSKKEKIDRSLGEVWQKGFHIWMNPEIYGW